MSTSDIDKLSSTMARLRHKYKAGLAERAEELMALVTSYERGPSPDKKEEVMQLVHRLAGTAGSFGVDDVSEMASHVEVRVSQGEELADVRPAIGELVERMYEHARSVDPDAGPKP